MSVHKKKNKEKFGMMRFGEFLEANDDLAYTLNIVYPNSNIYLYLFYSFYVRNNPQQHTTTTITTATSYTCTHAQRHTRSDKRK